MRLLHGRHLAYCTNIHRGETWAETWAALQRHTLAVRDLILPSGPFAIGLRLSAEAARELGEPDRLAEFRRWLDRERCYVFTINGFPYGQFHGGRVKEQVYSPDWTTPERLAYTNRLFDILTELLPPDVDGSVSTVPVSFKAFQRSDRELSAARTNLWRCVEHIERLSRRSGRRLHLGLEPEPLCTLETTSEAVAFFDALRSDRPGDQRLDEHLGVNYDCCHQAVEFESASEALDRLRHHRIRLSKIHLSNALRVQPTRDILQRLHDFADSTYLHQVVERTASGRLTRWTDLPDALARHNQLPPPRDAEWRIHFHVPLHQSESDMLGTTSDHVSATLNWLQENPSVCSHLEMETYTWEVLPRGLRSGTVVDQLADEYSWTLHQLCARALA